VVGIGQKADRGANSKWRLPRGRDRHNVASRTTAAAQPAIRLAKCGMQRSQSKPLNSEVSKCRGFPARAPP
jgi:hypothetical protein